MNTPRDINSLIPFVQGSHCSKPPTVLTPEDEAYLEKQIEAIRAGKAAVVIVEYADTDKVKYMFSNASRAEAVSMLGKVIEATGRRLASGE